MLYLSPERYSIFSRTSTGLRPLAGPVSGAVQHSHAADVRRLPTWPAAGRVLSAYGILFHIAGDIVEAVQLLLRHGPAIDVVLLDADLRGDWPGPLALVAVRAFAPAVPCCVLAGGVGPDVEDGLMRLGAATVWPKPLGDLGEFVRRLRELARRPAGRG
jgi:hypothetical protein